MQLVLLIFLIVLGLFFIEAGFIWATVIIAALIFADFFGNVTVKFLGFLKNVFTGVVDSSVAEFEETEKAKAKFPSGKKFAEDYLKSTGKEIGKSTKATKEGKQLKMDVGFFSTLGKITDSFFNGITGILKK